VNIGDPDRDERPGWQDHRDARGGAD
jgi:hypothetical protein